MSAPRPLRPAASGPQMPLSFQGGLERPGPSVAAPSAAGAAGQGLELHAGGFHLLDLRGLHPLFPCAQGVLEGPLAEDEGLWLEHPHHVGTTPVPHGA